MLEQLPDSLGEALDELRAGIDQSLYRSIDLRQGIAAIRVGSLAFADHAPIPQKYTADGSGMSPPLHWSGVPLSASEVVLIVEDVDSPTPHPLVQAIAVALPVRTGGDGEPTLAAPQSGDGALSEGALGADDVAAIAQMGRNSMLQTEWLPPDPPPGHGVHRYLFQVFALGPGEPLDAHPGRDALRHAIETRGVASGCLVGTYERPSGRIDTPAFAADPKLAS